MNTLYFFRARHAAECQQVVFLFTAENDDDARAQGLAMIAEPYRADYSHDVEVEIVCRTLDTVLCFEPV